MFNNVIPTLDNAINNPYTYTHMISAISNAGDLHNL